jgi:hypothetical protein
MKLFARYKKKGGKPLLIRNILKNHSKRTILNIVFHRLEYIYFTINSRTTN